MIERDLKKNKKKTYNCSKKEEKDIRNFVDMQAITILLHLSGSPKTRSELIAELKEIPSMSLYRKMDKLEEFGLIRKIMPPHKKMKRNNIMYESTSRNFVVRDRGRVIRMAI